MNYLIKNTSIVNEGKISHGDVHLKKGRIERIDPSFAVKEAVQEIDGSGLHLLPGAIDDQVHFREPGLTHKASIGSESRAAVAGGVTSFMEMPNTVPNTLTLELLEQKYHRASETSLANYSFFMGTSNDNLEEVLKANERKQDICGLKIFMGSSTGNMLVDNPLTLDKVFAGTELLVATHCEEEAIIRQHLHEYEVEGKLPGPADHPLIRNEEACYESSVKAIQLAQRHGTRLHILHISTEKELALFGNMMPLKDKQITAEVCVHHLHFTADDYAAKGYQIKCNPAIKAAHNKEALWKALLDDKLDVIATDHAPHTMAEKGLVRDASGHLVPVLGTPYASAHAGLPLVQHSLLLMLHYVREGRIPLETVVRKMSHAVADLFRIQDRGYLREGYYADAVLVDLNSSTRIQQDNLLYHCGWSPLEGSHLPARIHTTFVNGFAAYTGGKIVEGENGMRMRFGG